MTRRAWSRPDAEVLSNFIDAWIEKYLPGWLTSAHDGGLDSNDPEDEAYVSLVDKFYGSTVMAKDGDVFLVLVGKVKED